MATRAKSAHYVKNKDLLKEIIDYRATCQYGEDGKYIEGSGQMSEILGRNGH